MQAQDALNFLSSDNSLHCLWQRRVRESSCLYTVSTCASHCRGSRESGGLSDALMAGDAKQRAERASSALAKAFASGKGLDAAMQAAAKADALEAEEALKAERRR